MKKHRLLTSVLVCVVMVSLVLSLSLAGCKTTADTGTTAAETTAAAVETTAAAAETTAAAAETTAAAAVPIDEMAVKAAKELAGGKAIELNCLFTWDSPGAALEKVIPEWEAATGIKINYERLSTLEISQKIQLELSSGDVKYDMFQYDGYLRKPLLENQNVMVLDDFIKKYDPQWDTFIPGMKEFGINDAGEQKAIISYWCDYIMVYRSDLTDDPKEHAAFKEKYGYDYDMQNLDWDKSYKDLAEFFTRDTNGDGKTDIWGAAEMGAEYAAGDSFMAQYLNRFKWDKPFLFDTATGKCNLDDEYTRATLNSMKELIDKKYMIPEYLQTDWASILGVFGSGKAVMATCYGPSWAPLQAESKDFPFSGPKYVGFAPVPGSATGAKRSTISSGWINLIPKSAPNAELAYLFILWSTSPKIDKEMALTTLHNPVRTTTYADPDVMKANPLFAAEFAHPEGLYALPDYLIYEETQKILSDEMAGFMSGKTKLDDAIAKTVSDIDAKWQEYQK
jgi:multiple sugar transport system substrate-binding protein